MLVVTAGVLGGVIVGLFAGRLVRGMRQRSAPGRAAPEATASATASGERDTSALISSLIATSAEQAASMRSLAEMTAESLRSATGAYVFELRDRFDAALPPVAIGVADHTWKAVATDGLDPADDVAGAPVDALVFHPGDVVRFVARFACNQAPVRRTLHVEIEPQSDRLLVGEPQYRSGTWVQGGRECEMPSDVSTFIALPIDVEVGSLSPGMLRFGVTGSFTVHNTRPEGATSTRTFSVTIRALVVPDDDGIGLDLVTVEAEVEPEKRTYWLDKATGLELSLPRPAAAGGAPAWATPPIVRAPSNVGTAVAASLDAVTLPAGVDRDGSDAGIAAGDDPDDDEARAQALWDQYATLTRI